MYAKTNGVEKRSNCDWCGKRKENVDGQTVDFNNEGGHYLESKLVMYIITYLHTCRVKVHARTWGVLGSERPRSRVELWGIGIEEIA